MHSFSHDIFVFYDTFNVFLELTFSQDIDLSSTVFNVTHLQLTTTLLTHDLWALNLHMPQLYPLEVTPECTMNKKLISPINYSCTHLVRPLYKHCKKWAWHESQYAKRAKSFPILHLVKKIVLLSSATFLLQSLFPNCCWESYK